MLDTLRIQLLNPDEIIRKRDIKYVEDTHVFDSGTEEPSDKGLLSPEIFGDTFDERRKKLGAIKLDGFYLHPLIYSRVFKRHWRKIDQLISGEKMFMIDDDGKLKEAEDEREGYTGLKFLYDRWEDINIENLDIKEKDSVMLKQIKNSIHELSKNDVFIDKWLVIPLMFRDVHEADGGHISLDIINEKYKKLLSYIKVIENSQDNPLFDKNQMRFRIQLQLTEIFDFLMDKALRGKDSVMKKQVQSKKIDYTSRMVISAPSFKNDKIGDTRVDVDTCGIPLSASADMFAPFVINNMYSILETMFDRGDITGSREEFDDMYNKQELHEIINTYVESWGERFDPLVQPDNPDEPIYIEGEYKDEEGDWVEFKRQFTITDLIYQAAYQSIEADEKYNILSRYPINKVAS